jgi:hypothetical protein
MPKEASMTPATKHPKKIPTKKTKIKTISGTQVDSESTPKKQTKSKQTNTNPYNIKYNSDMEKFPYETFPYRLEYNDKSEKRVCWFQDESHYMKYIDRYKLNKKEYILECSFVNQNKTKS